MVGSKLAGQTIAERILAIVAAELPKQRTRGDPSSEEVGGGEDSGPPGAVLAGLKLRLGPDARPYSVASQMLRRLLARTPALRARGASVRTVLRLRRLVALERELALAQRRLTAARDKATQLQERIETQREVLAKKTAAADQLKARLQERTGELRSVKGEARSLSFRLEAVPRFRYCSYTPGVPGWERRWDDRPGRRVLLYAPRDFAGSAMNLAEATNRHTAFAARVASFTRHQFGYPGDLLMPPPGLDDSGWRRLLEEADVIHVVDETFFTDEAGPLPRDFYEGLAELRQWVLEKNSPRVYTHLGGYARKFRDDADYRRQVLACEARIAMSPDLAFDWFEGDYVPLAIDMSRFEYAWANGHRIAHSPSSRQRKGTDLFLEAMRGVDAELDLIENVGHAECMARMRNSTLFFDQAGNEQPEKLGVDHVIGWYGTAAVEAQAYGIPTVAHLSREALDNARRAGKDIEERCAVLNVPRDPDGMRSVIQAFLRLDKRGRERLSRQARQWAEEFHDLSVVGPELATIYERVLSI